MADRSYTLDEQETILRWDEADRVVTVESFSPVRIRHFKRLLDRIPDAQVVTDEDDPPHLRVEIPLRALSITARKKVVLSAERKAVLAERMRKLHRE